MKYIGALIIGVSLVFLAHLNTRSVVDLQSLNFLQVGVEQQNVLEEMGRPTKQTDHSWSYALKHDAQLVIFWNANSLESAVLKFSPPRNLTNLTKEAPPHLVRVHPDLFPKQSLSDQQAEQWYYAGSPANGKLWKIFKNGTVESISWIRPFKNFPFKNELKSTGTTTGRKQSVAN